MAPAAGKLHSGPSLAPSQLPLPAKLSATCWPFKQSHFSAPLTHRVLSTFLLFIFQMIHFLPVFSFPLLPALEKVLGKG